MTFSYSYSALSTYLQCPFLFKEKYLVKSIKYQQNEAAAYGSEMHLALENLIQDKQEFTPRYEFLKPIVNWAKSVPGEKRCEYELAFKEGWVPTEFRDKSALIKGKADLVIFHPEKPKMLLKDWKFSRVEPKNYDLELQTFCLLNFKRHPEIEEIKTGLVWLKIPAPETVRTFKKEDEPELEDTIMGLIARVEDAICFDKFPNHSTKPFLCKSYCDALNCPKNGKNK